MMAAMPTLNPAEPARHLVIDGRDDRCGRALLAISALHLCAAELAVRRVVLIDVTQATVEVAAEALGCDTGLQVECRPPEDRRDPFAGAALYVAVAFRDTTHLRHEEARRSQVPMLVAVQFPARSELAGVPMRAAHDTQALATEILDALQNQAGRVEHA